MNINKKQPNKEKQAPRQQGNHKHEEFGAEFDFDEGNIREDGRRSNKKPVSERTAWH